MVRAVALIADLEGICGVDSLEALFHADAGYPRAARQMTDELVFVIERLRARGVEQVRVIDSHRSGAASNVDASRLPAGAELQVPEDSYGAAVFSGVDAVACVGMHAAALSPGFAAHTVTVSPAWRVGGQLVSEAHLVAWLAAEQGVPFWFCSGDDVLGHQLEGLPFVQAKVSASLAQTRSRPWAEVAAAYEAALAQAPRVVAPPGKEIELQFREVRELEAAVNRVGLRTGLATATVEGPTFREAYRRALRVIEAAGAVESEWKGVTELFLRPWVT